MKKFAVSTIIVICFCQVGFSQIGPAGNTAFSYQGRLHFKGDPVEGLYDFDFYLYDVAEGGRSKWPAVRVTKVNVERGHFAVSLDFGSSAFNGDKQWLEIHVGPYKSGAIKAVLAPRQQIAVAPYAIHAANADRASEADHAVEAESVTGTVDISQITGLLGQGVTLSFPDVLYNTATLEIGNIIGLDAAVIVSGLGFETDRIVTYDGYGRPIDEPGFSMEYPFVIEVEAGEDADSVTTYFDDYAANPEIGTQSMSIIVDDVAGDERFRWNLSEYAPSGYEAGVDGRRRFTFVHTLPPDNIMGWNMAVGLFGDDLAYNPATDSWVMFPGIGAGLCAVPVEVDSVERTLTLTFDYNEGDGVYEWVRYVIYGNLTGAEKRDISVIEYDASYVEVGRTNYYNCFPIRYEVLDGFGLNVKIRHRVVLTFSWFEDA